MIQMIKSRSTGEVLFERAAESFKLALEAAIEAEVNLSGADLQPHG